MGEVVQLNSFRGGTMAAKSSACSSELSKSARNDNVVNDNIVKKDPTDSCGLSETGEKELAVSDRDSLIPIELAVGSTDRNYCLTRMAKYEVCAIHIRMVKDDPDALLYLMSVNDAIWLNKEILEERNLTDDEVCRRIDLIQMLENVNGALMDSLWDSFTKRSQAIIS